MKTGYPGNAVAHRGGQGQDESEGLSMEVWDGWGQEKHREIELV